MSAIGTKQTSVCGLNVRFGGKADIIRTANMSAFDPKRTFRLATREG